MSTTRIRHVAEVNPSTPEFDKISDNEPVTFLPLEAVWPGSRLDVARTRSKQEVSSGYTRFREYDVLVPKITPTFEADRSTIARGLRQSIGVGTTELHIVRPGSKLDVRYANYLLSSRYFLQGGKAAMKGVAGQQRVPDEWLLDFHVPIAGLTQQRAVADFLDAETARIDALIEKKRRMHSAIEERFRSERDQRIRRLMADHGSTTVRRLVDGVEQGWSPSCENVEADPNEWGVLKTSAVTQGIFKGTENKRLPDDLQPDLRWTVKDGDVLVARGSGSLERVGTAAVAATEERNLMISDLIYRLVSPRMNSTLLAHCLNSSIGRTHLESSIRTDVGQTLKIRGDDLLDTPIPGVASKLQAPALEEIERRRRIANETIERLSAQLELLTEHRQALITAAVTGQMEVTRSQQLGEPR